MPIETPELRALRVGLAQTIAGLHDQVRTLQAQGEALAAQNRQLAGHVSDLLEMVGRLQAAVRSQEAA
jgi:cell division protein FtsB